MPLLRGNAAFDPLLSLAALPITSIQVKVDCTDNIAFWQATLGTIADGQRSLKQIVSKCGSKDGDRSNRDTLENEFWSR